MTTGAVRASGASPACAKTGAHPAASAAAASQRPKRRRCNMLFVIADDIDSPILFRQPRHLLAREGHSRTVALGLAKPGPPCGRSESRSVVRKGDDIRPDQFGPPRGEKTAKETVPFRGSHSRHDPRVGAFADSEHGHASIG